MTLQKIFQITHACRRVTAYFPDKIQHHHAPDCQSIAYVNGVDRGKLNGMGPLTIYTWYLQNAVRCTEVIRLKVLQGRTIIKHGIHSTLDRTCQLLSYLLHSQS